MNYGDMEKKIHSDILFLISKNILFWRDILKVQFVSRKQATSFYLHSYWMDSYT